MGKRESSEAKKREDQKAILDLGWLKIYPLSLGDVGAAVKATADLASAALSIVIVVDVLKRWRR